MAAIFQCFWKMKRSDPQPRMAMNADHSLARSNPSIQIGRGVKCYLANFDFQRMESASLRPACSTTNKGLTTQHASTDPKDYK